MDLNINKPCELCREESISVSGGRFCAVCYKEIMINVFIRDYPISSKDLKEKWKMK